jgi:glycosyltransferase involved in cell wall biosynthesis
VGRLSPEKGTDLLLRVLELVPGYKLTVVGTGPQEAVFRMHPTVRSLGFLSRNQIFGQMRNAAYLLMPSICYESFPLALVEAFACGLPVIASRTGAMAELVEDGETGLLFEPGSAEDLARKITWAAARAEHAGKYTPDRNYEVLMGIYNDAIRSAT